ncbi:MAG: outer membrane protein OmpA-like peptidoglycan-associated protein [Crocinitomix sp.]|jgi:outer membrane protein OmpA-like peptidoglycan-associated protein/tetratricopeptide (TPR) repeat protein
MILIKKLPYLLIALLFIQTTAFSQDIEDESCAEPEDKKVLKLLKEAESTKNDSRERSMAYTQAVELAPDNAFIYYSFALFNFKKAEEVEAKFNQGRANFAQLSSAYRGAANTYKKVIENCPDFHSDAYYKLGYIYGLLGDQEQTTQYFKTYVDFDSKDPEKYNDDYAKNKAAIQESEPSNEFLEEFYANVVQFDPYEVRNVSSEKDEYLPIISPDNELILYSRKGKGDDPSGIVNGVIESFTMSQRTDVNSDFDSGEPLRRPFNTPQYTNYGGVSLSLDNKEMFICACQDVDYQAHANCDIYRTTFERGGQGGNDFTWTALENLGSKVNTPDGWEAQPTLSPDGNTLYFATWRDGSELTDIYFSTRQEDGSWSRAKAVPGPINSLGHDKAPFIHQDSETMYFVSECSDDRLGAGGTDIFYSRKDENGNWMEPTNIGHPINGAGNEVAFVVSTDGHLAYYTTRGPNTKGYDIYYFELYEEARPQKVKFVKGVVKDELGDPVKDAVVEVSYKLSGESVEVKVNGDDGKFATIINVDEEIEQDVMISIKKQGHSFDTKLIKSEELKSDDVFSEEPIAMQIDTLEVGRAFTIDDILYDTDSYTLSTDSKFILDQFVKFLLAHPTVNVTIQGHTDDVGNDGGNKVLSANRAKGAMQYIASKGIDKSRLNSEGFGESKPKFQNSTAENRAKNRRTDFLITNY